MTAKTHLIPDTLDRAKALGNGAYGIILAIQGIANSMAENNLREVKATFRLSESPVTVEVKR